MTATYNITINAYSGSIINIGDMRGCASHCHVSCSIIECTGSTSSSFSPTDIGDLLHWYKSDEGVNLTGSNVAGWNDRIGVIDGIQATSSHQPVFVTNELNGYPAITFSPGASQNETSSLDVLIFPYSIPNPWSVLLTWRLDAPSVGTFDGSGNDAKSYVLTSVDNPFSASTMFSYLSVGPGQHISGSTLVNGFTSSSVCTELNYGSFGTTIITSDTSLTTLINNDVVITSGALSPVGLYNVSLGTNIYNSFRSGARMSVVEMMVFTGSLSTGNITALTNYANTRYAL